MTRVRCVPDKMAELSVFSWHLCVWDQKWLHSRDFEIHPLFYLQSSYPVSILSRWWSDMRAGLKVLCCQCCHASPRPHSHHAILTNRSLIRSPASTTSPPARHTHLPLTHTHIHTPMCAQTPTRPSPHHPLASPLSFFQGAHGKPPESAGLRRTWAWANSFPWLWTWDHQLLFFELSLSLCCLSLYFDIIPPVSANHFTISTSCFPPSPLVCFFSPLIFSLRYWHFLIIWLPLKETFSQRSIKSMPTFMQNGKTSALIFADKRWEQIIIKCQSCVGFLLLADEHVTYKVYHHPSKSSPTPLLDVGSTCMFSVQQQMWVYENVMEEVEKERMTLERILVNTVSCAPSSPTLDVAVQKDSIPTRLFRFRRLTKLKRVQSFQLGCFKSCWSNTCCLL